MNEKEEIKQLRRDLDDLESQWQIIWRFYIQPLWAKLYEVLNVEPTDPKAHRLYPGETIPGPGHSLDEVKRHYVLTELRRLRGNKMKTARSLGVNVKTLYNMLRKWGILDEPIDASEEEEETAETQRRESAHPESGDVPLG